MKLTNHLLAHQCFFFLAGGEVVAVDGEGLQGIVVRQSRHHSNQRLRVHANVRHVQRQQGLGLLDEVAHIHGPYAAQRITTQIQFFQSISAVSHVT